MKFKLREFHTLISQDGLFADGDWVESKDQDPNGEVRLVQLADIGTGEFIDKSNRYMTREKAKELRCTFLEAGDILIARMPDPIGRACIFPGSDMPCVTVVDVCIVRPLSSDVDSRWLMHTINSKNFNNNILQFVTGTTRQRISRGNLSKLKIPLPPLAEQKRIAAILDKADSLRRKNQQAIQLADQFLRAVFLDMFGDPVTNPKGWDKTPLSELIKVSSGNGLIASQMDINGKFPVYGGNGINGHHSEYMFEEPQLVIGRVGVYCGVIHITESKAWITDNALYVKEYKQEIDMHFLAESLKQANLNQYAGRAAQPLVSGSRIYPLKVLVPPLDNQKEFSKLKKDFLGLTEKFDNSKLFSEYLFNSLSQKAFAGEL